MSRLCHTLAALNKEPNMKDMVISPVDYVNGADTYSQEEQETVDIEICIKTSLFPWSELKHHTVLILR